MSRTHVRRRRLLAILGVALVTARAAPVAANAFGGPQVTEGRRVVVQADDTLWDIAVRLEPGSDPREVVAAMVQANHLDGAAIVPGQTLTVPAVG